MTTSADGPGRRQHRGPCHLQLRSLQPIEDHWDFDWLDRVIDKLGDVTVAGPHVQVLASYAGEEADEWELDGMAAITRNTYGEGEAYFLGCDLA